MPEAISGIKAIMKRNSTEGFVIMTVRLFPPLKLHNILNAIIFHLDLTHNSGIQYQVYKFGLSRVGICQIKRQVKFQFFRLTDLSASYYSYSLDKDDYRK